MSHLPLHGFFSKQGGPSIGNSMEFFLNKGTFHRGDGKKMERPICLCTDFMAEGDGGKSGRALKIWGKMTRSGEDPLKCPWGIDGRRSNGIMQG